jgi:hypothetical protein
MALLLDAHPEVASIGELGNAIGTLLRSGRIESYHCSCGVQIEQCSFWQRVQALCAEQGIDLDVHDFRTDFDSGLGDATNRILFEALGDLRPVQAFLGRVLGLSAGYRRRVEQTATRNVVIAQAVCDATGKSIFFDTSKSVGHAALLHRRDDLDFKMIHLVRDPRGVLNSYRKHRGDKAWQRATRHWKRVHLAARRLGSSLAEHAYLLVRYEDLCTRPEETLGGICRFLDVEEIDLVEEATGRQHHLIGNRMRLRAFNGLRLDEGWRGDLSAAEISHCMQIAGDVIGALGLGYGELSKCEAE